MRFLAVQPGHSFSTADVYAGWVEALRDLGQQVVEYNLDERLTFYSRAMIQVGSDEYRQAMDAGKAAELAAGGLYGALYQVWPDVLLVVSAHYVSPRVMDVARARGTRVVVLHTESPYENGRQARVAAHADLNIVNDPTGIDSFPAGTVYLPAAHRPAVHKPGPASPELACDLCFVGTGFPSRVEFLEAMDLDGLDVVLAGNWGLLDGDSRLRRFVAHGLGECLDNDKAVDLYRSARTGLNLYRREGEQSAGWACGPREIEQAACGLFFLREPRGEGDDLLPWLPTITSPEEASDLLRHWLKRPEEREALARKSMEAVADRTFTANATALLRLLDTER